MKTASLVLAFTFAPALSFAAGTSLSWNDCVGGPTAAVNKNFTCTGTANENYDLIFQFKSPVALSHFVGLSCFADYQNQSGTPLKPFWHYESGGCNNTVAAGAVRGIGIFDAQPSTAPSCHFSTNAGGSYSFHDPWNDEADGAGGLESFAAYGVDFHRPGNGYFVLEDAYVADTSEVLEADVNYYALHLRFNNRNRATCAGCADVGSIVLERIRLESDARYQGQVDLDVADDKPVSSQGGVQEIAIGQVPVVTINALAPVPTKPIRWSQLKSLYR